MGPLRLAPVAAGAIVGATLRWAVAEVAPIDTGALPWSTLATNVGGALVLGVIVGGAWLPPAWQAFAGTGLLGSFTTFSAFAVETDLLVTSGDPVLALVYVGLTVAVGIAAAMAGLRLGARGR